MIVDKATLLEFERKRKKRKKICLRIASYLIVAFLVVLGTVIIITKQTELICTILLCIVLFIGASEILYKLIELIISDIH